MTFIKDFMQLLLNWKKGSKQCFSIVVIVYVKPGNNWSTANSAVKSPNRQPPNRGKSTTTGHLLYTYGGVEKYHQEIREGISRYRQSRLQIRMGKVEVLA